MPLHIDNADIVATASGMDPDQEISVNLTEMEYSAMMSELGTGGQRLTAAASAAVLSAALDANRIARSFTCPIAVARELLLWCETGSARRWADDPDGAAVLERASSNIRYALRGRQQ